jgi:glycosyltransferase involved in cell wall biosynthesis
MKTVENVNDHGQILYAGNLGVGRHIPLIKIGAALQKLDTSLYLDVYGDATDDVKEALSSAEGVRYHGFVSYEENCKNIENSRLLIHVEGFDEYFSRDTKFAFSTKIADYCASGIPIFMYAPQWCESTKYAIKHDLAFVASNEEQMKDELQIALNDEKIRKEKVSSALHIAAKNHQMENNELQVAKIVESACG